MSNALTWTSRTWDPPSRNVTEWRSSTIEHGLKDGKGRAIGNYAVIEAHSTRWDSATGTQVPCETSYSVCTRATRDGATFGAIPSSTKIETLDAAKALAEKKIAAAGKRFARLVAKGEGKQFAPKAVAS